MLALFVEGSWAWSEKMLAIAGWITMETMGTPYKKNLSSVFRAAGDYDLADEPAATPAWFYYVERPPFNLHSFNHWHFLRNPYNPEQLEIHNHTDSDSLNVNIITLNRDIPKVSRSWPLAFDIKLALSSIADIFAPLHLTEYYDKEHFPNGDFNGRNFTVIANGVETSIFDFYESGCGEYPLKWEFTEESWKTIRELAEDIQRNHPVKDIQISDAYLRQVIADNQKYTIENIYKVLTPGQTLSEEFINKCKDETAKRLSEAYSTMIAFLKRIQFAVHDSAKNAPEAPMNVTEITAWSLFFMLAPVTFLLIWKKHSSR